jgi:transposase
MLDLILDLYKVEYLAAEKRILGTDEHLAMRQEQSTVILEKIKRWLDAKKILYPPKSEMGKAIIYARNQWTTLIAFKDDPLLCLDNNLAENALRIIALGRKNFLFTANEFCGQNLAILQTIVATCLLHGVKPYDYIRDVIIRIQDHPFDRIDELLPQNWAQHLSQSS